MWTTAFISCRIVISDISVPFEMSCFKTSFFLEGRFNPGDGVDDNWAKDCGDKPEDDRLSVTSWWGEVVPGLRSIKTRPDESMTSLRGETCRFSAMCRLSFSSLATFVRNQKTNAAAKRVKDNIHVTKMNWKKILIFIVLNLTIKIKVLWI